MEQEPHQTNGETPPPVETHAERAVKSPPRIWVGSTEDFKRGVLHGRWLRADREAREVLADIGELLAASATPNARRWQIVDHEGFGGVPLCPDDPLEAVLALARGIRDHGHALAGWSGLHADLPGVIEDFECSYLGEWPTVEAFVKELVDGIGVPEIINARLPPAFCEHFQPDAAAIAKKLEESGAIRVCETPSGGSWIYLGRPRNPNDE